MSNVDIVVVGQNYSTSLGIIHAAGEAGYKVGVVHSTIYPIKRLPLELKSKYVSNYLVVTDRYNEPLLISSLINKFSSSKQKVVLLPSDDYSVTIIDRNINELQKYFFVPNIRSKQGEIIRLMDKWNQSKLAIESGLLTAMCWRIELDGTSVPNLPNGIIYPCITKPLKSVGSSKNYIRRCDNQDELIVLLDQINKEKPCSILIEELINIDYEYTVPILSNGRDVLIPAFLEKKLTGSGLHKGVTIAGKVVSSMNYPDVVNNLKSLVKEAGLRGIFDIELFRSGDTFYFNELNLRYGAAGYALTRAGINMISLWINYCRDEKSIIQNLTLNEGLTFVSDKAAVDSFGDGFMSFKDYLHLVSSVNFRFLVDNQDTCVKYGFRLIEIKRILSRLLNR